MKAILDTGPWVALIDRSETKHNTCLRWLKRFTGQLYSTEAVLTEVLYLLNFSTKAQTAALDFVSRGAVELIPSNIESLETVKRLMLKYADLPMDYVHATIVCLAQETEIRDIATFDHKDFNVYRLPKRKTFRIWP